MAMGALVGFSGEIVASYGKVDPERRLKLLAPEEIMSNSAIKTARRVFEVLEYFEEQRRPLTLNNICRRFDYPPSSGIALLRSLVSTGYVNYDRDTKSYIPTLRLASMGTWIGEAILGEEILAKMSALVDDTNESVCIGAQSDINLQYVHVIHPDRSKESRIKPGILRPLTKSSLGLLLMSNKTDDEIENIINRINYMKPNEERVSLKEIISRVSRVRHDGFATSFGNVGKRTAMIGMMIPHSSCGRTMAIGIGGPIDRIASNESSLLSKLRFTLADMA